MRLSKLSLRRSFSTQCSAIVFDDHAQLQRLLSHLDSRQHHESSFYSRLLYLCGKCRCLEDGRRVHARLLQDMICQWSTNLGNNLVGMYGKCGSLEEAWLSFAGLQERNVVSWTTMISAFAHHGQEMQAMLLFQHMLLAGVHPDAYTLNILINVCAHSYESAWGRLLHDIVVDSGLGGELVLANSLINMYGKCGLPGQACDVFSDMPQRNIVSWATLLAAFAREGDFQEAVWLFRNLNLEGTPKPNAITFVSALEACQSQAEGKSIQSQAVEAGYDSQVLTGTALVDFFGKCGDVHAAAAAFEKLQQRTVVSWTAMIGAYAQTGNMQEALYLYQTMLLEGIEVGAVTVVTLLGALTHPVEQIEKQIHEAGLSSTTFVGNALVSIYSKLGQLDQAREWFNNIQKKDTVSWNTMAAAYAQAGNCVEAFACLRNMRLLGVKSNGFTFTATLAACTSKEFLREGELVHREAVLGRGLTEGALMMMYARCGHLDKAVEIFEAMEDGIRDLAAWNTLITVYGLDLCSHDVFKTFKRMKLEGLVPDRITCVSVLDSCTSSTDLEEGKRVHVEALESGCLDVLVGNALLYMYGKCGSLKDAEVMFAEMPTRSLVSWTSMLALYAHHGDVHGAGKLFGRLQQAGFKPNAVTFTSLLFACCHAGLVEQGCLHFASLTTDFDLTPTEEHFMCLVDLLSRAGRLAEAEEMIGKITSHQPREARRNCWMTLLSSCRASSDVRLGERAARGVLSLDDEESGAYVVLSKMYENQPA